MPLVESGRIILIDVENILWEQISVINLNQYRISVILTGVKSVITGSSYSSKISLLDVPYLQHSIQSEKWAKTN